MISVRHVVNLLFDWYNLVVENMNNTMIAPVRRIDRRIITLDRIITILTDLQANFFEIFTTTLNHNQLFHLQNM